MIAPSATSERRANRHGTRGIRIDVINEGGQSDYLPEGVVDQRNAYVKRMCGAYVRTYGRADVTVSVIAPRHPSDEGNRLQNLIHAFAASGYRNRDGSRSVSITGGGTRSTRFARATACCGQTALSSSRSSSERLPTTTAASPARSTGSHARRNAWKKSSSGSRRRGRCNASPAYSVEELQHELDALSRAPVPREPS